MTGHRHGTQVLRECPVCGLSPGHCNHPSRPHAGYPFLPPADREPPMAPTQILAPHRIVDNERVVYGQGEPMTYEDAVRYGVIPAPDLPGPVEIPDQGPEEARPKRRRSRGEAA